MSLRALRTGLVPWSGTLVLVALVALAGRASAHGGGLGTAGREAIAVPTWLFLTTGGAAVAASFLTASVVTDRSVVDAVHERHRSWGIPAGAAVASLGRVLGLVGLLVVVVGGLLGPSDPAANPAVLLVWVGWWAGLAMAAYLVGNAWPALNPWSTIAAFVPSLERSYPERLGAWPAVAGLLALAWAEVAGAVASSPPLLAALALAYTGVTLAGAAVVGPATWFQRVDPLARAFRLYGRVAPLSVRDGELRFGLPGASLRRPGGIGGLDEVAFVVALLWATTFDGLSATGAWAAVTAVAGDLGVPAPAVALAGLVGGFGLFFGAYLLAVRVGRSLARTHCSARTLAVRFAPPLLAIAAGYHFAHYAGYLLSNLPRLAAAVAAPLGGGHAAAPLVLPDWFGGVALAGVLGGHVLAVWAAHAAAFDLFPGRLQAVRSQYPFVAVMVGYTATSLWIVTQPAVQP